MKKVSDRSGDAERTRERLSKIGRASRRIAESVDLEVILQEVVDGARSLTEARYGALAVFDDSGSIIELFTSGITPEERQQVGSLPKGLGLLGYLDEIREPLRLADIGQHSRSVGTPENHPPMKTFLGVPLRYQSQPVGNLYLTEKEGNKQFSAEDEVTLIMFASQAAAVVANAKRYEYELRAKANLEIEKLRLEAVIKASPVGILVVDAETGVVVSVNREAERIFGIPPEQGIKLDSYQGVATYYRADGRELPVHELPLSRALSRGETVHAEEIIFHVLDGRKITTLVNATPIHSKSVHRHR